MPHSPFNSPTSTQVARVDVIFLIVILLFWPIARGGAEQGQQMMMEAEMILAIEDRLARDEFVQENLIDVVSEKGIVTLLGEVDNILAKERTAALAGTIKEVRSVMNQSLVNPPNSLENQDIEDRVKSALLENPATELYAMNVRVTDGRVPLTGTVQSWQEKQLALQVAKGSKESKTFRIS